MVKTFAHLLPEDIEVWERYLKQFQKEYTYFEYDIRVGLGRDPGPEYEENIRKMALDLSYRRIDCVAHKRDRIVVIEITHSAGFKAIGQVLGYTILYKLTYMPTEPIEPLLVCGTVQSDISHIIESRGIPCKVV
jgi:hypothetical protein